MLLLWPNNNFDIAILLGILLSFLSGGIRGASAELVDIFKIIAIAIVPYKIVYYVASLMSDYVAFLNPDVLYIISYFLLLFSVGILANSIGGLVKNLLQNILVSGLNNILGVIFGGIKFLLVSMVLYFIANATLELQKYKIINSSNYVDYLDAMTKYHTNFLGIGFHSKEKLKDGVNIPSKEDFNDYLNEIPIAVNQTIEEVE